MQINILNSIQNFKGIMQYKGMQEVKSKNSVSRMYTYYYYPFADETKREIKDVIKKNNYNTDCEYKNCQNGKRHYKFDRTVTIEQKPINLTKAEYHKMKEHGDIDSEILLRVLNK